MIVWFGAVTTSALFTLGKSILGLYRGRAGVGSAYGAAGSLVVLTVWVYYTSMIVLQRGGDVPQISIQPLTRGPTPQRAAGGSLRASR